MYNSFLRRLVTVLAVFVVLVSVGALFTTGAMADGGPHKYLGFSGIVVGGKGGGSRAAWRDWVRVLGIYEGDNADGSTGGTLADDVANINPWSDTAGYGVIRHWSAQGETNGGPVDFLWNTFWDNPDFVGTVTTMGLTYDRAEHKKFVPMIQGRNSAGNVVCNVNTVNGSEIQQDVDFWTIVNTNTIPAGTYVIFLNEPESSYQSHCPPEAAALMYKYLVNVRKSHTPDGRFDLKMLVGGSAAPFAVKQSQADMPSGHSLYEHSRYVYDVNTETTGIDWLSRFFTAITSPSSDAYLADTNDWPAGIQGHVYLRTPNFNGADDGLTNAEKVAKRASFLTYWSSKQVEAYYAWYVGRWHESFSYLKKYVYSNNEPQYYLSESDIFNHGNGGVYQYYLDHGLAAPEFWITEWGSVYKGSSFAVENGGPGVWGIERYIREFIGTLRLRWAHRIYGVANEGVTPFVNRHMYFMNRPIGDFDGGIFWHNGLAWLSPSTYLTPMASITNGDYTGINDRATTNGYVTSAEYGVKPSYYAFEDCNDKNFFDKPSWDTRDVRRCVDSPDTIVTYEQYTKFYMEPSGWNTYPLDHPKSWLSVGEVEATLDMDAGTGKNAGIEATYCFTQETIDTLEQTHIAYATIGGLDIVNELGPLYDVCGTSCGPRYILPLIVRDKDAQTMVTFTDRVFDMLDPANNVTNSDMWYYYDGYWLKPITIDITPVLQWWLDNNMDDSTDGDNCFSVVLGNEYMPAGFGGAQGNFLLRVDGAYLNVKAITGDIVYPNTDIDPGSAVVPYGSQRDH